VYDRIAYITEAVLGTNIESADDRVPLGYCNLPTLLPFAYYESTVPPYLRPRTSVPSTKPSAAQSGTPYSGLEANNIIDTPAGRHAGACVSSGDRVDGNVELKLR